VLGAELPEPFTRVLQDVGRCSEDETHVVGYAERLAWDAEEVLFLDKGYGRKSQCQSRLGEVRAGDLPLQNSTSDGNSGKCLMSTPRSRYMAAVGKVQYKPGMTVRLE
jgi:hypothetical protein